MCWRVISNAILPQPKADALTGRILYSFRRCPYAMRARLARAVSRVDCALREIKLSAKPAAMLIASPKGTVPVLVQPDGAVIDESLDIMRWALAQSDPSGWLMRDDPALIAANDGAFKRALDRYKYPDRYGTDACEHRAMGLEFLRGLETRLAFSDALCGPHFGLTDAAIVPFVRQFAGVEPAWFAVQSLPRVQRWLDAFLGSALYAAIMLRLAPWSPGDPPVPMPQAPL